MVVVGSISYIGLIVPNVVAMYKGDKIRGTLVDTALFGAIFVLVCDMIGRVVIAPYELPIELIVGILGSLIFIALLFFTGSSMAARPSVWAAPEQAAAPPCPT